MALSRLQQKVESLILLFVNFQHGGLLIWHGSPVNFICTFFSVRYKKKSAEKQFLKYNKIKIISISLNNLYLFSFFSLHILGICSGK